MMMITYLLRTGEVVTAWVKLGWDPDKDPHGSSAAMIDWSGAPLRTWDDAVNFVSDKAQRAVERGATHLLLIAADGQGERLLAGRLVPIGILGQVMRAALTADEGLAWNGRSPSLYILGTQGGEKLIADVVHDHSVDHLTTASANIYQDDALQDLNDVPPGVDQPGKELRSAVFIARDRAVRDFVIDRAGGRCEYCKEPGFLMANGRRYLEAHHIILLAKNGPDTVQNVIALCPKDHREAHYGAEKETLEVEMQSILNLFDVHSK